MTAMPINAAQLPANTGTLPLAWGVPGTSATSGAWGTTIGNPGPGPGPGGYGTPVGYPTPGGYGGYPTPGGLVPIGPGAPWGMVPPSVAQGMLGAGGVQPPSPMRRVLTGAAKGALVGGAAGAAIGLIPFVPPGVIGGGLIGAATGAAIGAWRGLRTARAEQAMLAAPGPMPVPDTRGPQPANLPRRVAKPAPKLVNGHPPMRAKHAVNVTSAIGARPKNV